MSITFQKTVENFICEHCAAPVTGNGFTNHCSRCLWSKHVDIHPGDRSSQCGGLMEPREVILKEGRYVILHVCSVCSFNRLNKTSRTDEFSAILAVSNSAAGWRSSHRR